MRGVYRSRLKPPELLTDSSEPPRYNHAWSIFKIRMITSVLCGPDHNNQWWMYHRETDSASKQWWNITKHIYSFIHLFTHFYSNISTFTTLLPRNLKSNLLLLLFSFELKRVTTRCLHLLLENLWRFTLSVWHKPISKSSRLLKVL